jgi:hypothetical protein
LRLLHETTPHNPRNLACFATLHPHSALPPNQSLPLAPFYLFQPPFCASAPPGRALLSSALWHASPAQFKNSLHSIQFA